MKMKDWRNTNRMRKETQRGLQKHITPSQIIFIRISLMPHFKMCPYATSLIWQTSHLQPLPVLFLPTDFSVSFRGTVLYWEKSFGCLHCSPRVFPLFQMACAKPSGYWWLNGRLLARMSEEYLGKLWNLDKRRRYIFPCLCSLCASSKM